MEGGNKNKKLMFSVVNVIKTSVHLDDITK